MKNSAKDAIEVIRECSSMLASVNESYWSKKLDDSLKKFKLSQDEHILTAEVKSWFGGMGSINDLLISSVNGHTVDTRSEREKNLRLAGLRVRLFEFVRGK